jgi:hypothetical protein
VFLSSRIYIVTEHTNSVNPVLSVSRKLAESTSKQVDFEHMVSVSNPR